MPQPRPTVRQLQPLGRRDHPALAERVTAPAREIEREARDATTRVLPRTRWRRWLTLA